MIKILLGVVWWLGSGKGESRVAMCGIPTRALDTHLKKLIDAGRRVAICEQLETPAAAKLRGAKLVRREVQCLITAGTLVCAAVLVFSPLNP